MPDNDWTPDAPPVQTDFSNAHDNTPDVTPAESHETQPAIATKAEAERLHAEIAKPKLEHKMTIGGTVEQIVNEKTDTDNRTRLAYELRGLQKAREKELVKTFNKNGRDPLKRSFNRSSGLER